ncbi:MAG: protein-disulfide reductase DsbD domain-containing protein [Bacteroidota bacterium]
MVRYLFPFFFLFFQFQSVAQNHVNWTFEYDKTMKKVVVYGRIDSHWHVYSTRTKKNAGPIPVSFSFEKNNDAIQKGKPREEGVPVRLIDPNFDATVYQFENIYIVEIPFKIKKSTTLRGVVNYMVCDDKMCLPPIDVPFSIQVIP